jgi:hypothetical protein
MHDPGIATAADYADAMMTARKAKHVIILVLLLVLLGQMTIFFLARYNVINISPDATAVTTAVATTQQSKVNWTEVWHTLMGVCLLLGMVLPIVLGFVLLLIVNIMLVGRLIGVARLTGAYIWCLVLLVLLFPWQLFWAATDFSTTEASWKLPGVLYTWYEITHPTVGAHFAAEPMFPNATVHWARYVAFPLLALIILLAIQVKSNRGMRQALGEDDLDTVVTTSTPGTI